MWINQYFGEKPQSVKNHWGWKEAPHRSLWNLGPYHSLRSTLHLSPGKCLTSLGLSKLLLIISLHCSFKFCFPFPWQAQVPRKMWRAHTGLSLVTNAGMSSGTSLWWLLENEGHFRYLFSLLTHGFLLLIQLLFLDPHGIPLVGQIEKLFVLFRQRIKVPTPVEIIN